MSPVPDFSPEKIESLTAINSLVTANTDSLLSLSTRPLQKIFLANGSSVDLSLLSREDMVDEFYQALHEIAEDWPDAVEEFERTGKVAGTLIYPGKHLIGQLHVVHEATNNFDINLIDRTEFGLDIAEKPSAAVLNWVYKSCVAKRQIATLEAKEKILASGGLDAELLRHLEQHPAMIQHLGIHPDQVDAIEMESSENYGTDASFITVPLLSDTISAINIAVHDQTTP